MEGTSSRERTRELIRRAARDAALDTLGRAADLVESASGTIFALYRERGGRLELERTNAERAPRALDDVTSLARALERAERPVALDDPDDERGLGPSAAALARAGFDRAAGAFEDRLEGLLAVREPRGENAAWGPLDAAVLALRARRLRAERDDASARLRVRRALDDVEKGRTLIEQGFVATHRLSSALEHELAAFATVGHGGARIIAMSGRESVDRADPAVRRLEAIARAAAREGRVLYALRVPEAARAAALALAGRGPTVVAANASAEDEAAAFARAAHAELDASGRAAVVAFPLSVGGIVRGVLLAEGDAAALATATAADRLDTFGRGVENAIERLLDVKDVPLVSLLALLRPVVRWLQSIPYGTALGVVLVAAPLIAAGELVPVSLDVEGRCATVARERAAVRAPRDGTLATVLARDGARVEAGEVLATLTSEHHSAELVAPISGVFLAPDLEERLGAEVRSAERLATVGSVERPRVEVEVAERDRALLVPGARAEVFLTGRAAPLGAHLREVRAVHPTSASTGRVKETTLRIVAVLELDDDASEVEPGHAGRAVLRCGRVRLRAFVARVLAPWLERRSSR